MIACHCRTPLHACHGCGEPRCLRCEPYVSEDCWTPPSPLRAERAKAA